MISTPPPPPQRTHVWLCHRQWVDYHHGAQRSAGSYLPLERLTGLQQAAVDFCRGAAVGMGGGGRPGKSVFRYSPSPPPSFLPLLNLHLLLAEHHQALWQIFNEYIIKIRTRFAGGAKSGRMVGGCVCVVGGAVLHLLRRIFLSSRARRRALFPIFITVTLNHAADV